jgi:hypothetical protein
LLNDCAIRVTLPSSVSGQDWEEVDLLGHLDPRTVEAFMNQLPAPQGVSSRGRRAIRRRTQIAGL